MSQYEASSLQYDEPEEMALFRDTVRRFARQYLTKEYINECEEGHRPPDEAYKKAAELGFLGLGIPEEYGGTGGGIRELAVMFEELSYGWRTFASLCFRSAVHGGQALLSFGNEEQRRSFLPKLASGQVKFCFSISEPQGGSDAANVRVTARRDGDHYVINGQKVWSSGSHLADYITLVARTSNTGKKQEGLSMILVPRESAGITIRRIPTMVETSVGVNEVFYDDVRVSVSNLLGVENDGWQQASRNLEKERMAVAVMSLGQARLAFDLTLKYAKDRVVHGQPIGAHQVNTHRFADMLSMLHIGRLLSYDLVDRLESGRSARTEAALAKVFITDAYKQIVNMCVQMHGGYGVSKEYTIERLYREAPANQMGGGTTEVLKNVIGRHLGLKPIRSPQ